MLREEGTTANLGHLVASAVDGLLVLTHLLIVRSEVFGPEAFVAGQFVDGELADGYLGVYFIGNNDLFALVGGGFADGGAGEEAALVNLWGLLLLLLLLSPGVEHVEGIEGGAAALLLLLLTLLLLGGSGFDNLDGEAFGAEFLALGGAGGGSDGEGPFAVGGEGVGVGGMDGVGDSSVDVGGGVL